MISKEKKQAIMKEYARCEGDTGSPRYRLQFLQQEFRSLQSIYRAIIKIIIPEEVF